MPLPITIRDHKGQYQILSPRVFLSGTKSHVRLPPRLRLTNPAPLWMSAL